VSNGRRRGCVKRISLHFGNFAHFQFDQFLPDTVDNFRRCLRLMNRRLMNQLLRWSNRPVVAGGGCQHSGSLLLSFGSPCVGKLCLLLRKLCPADIPHSTVNPGKFSIRISIPHCQFQVTQPFDLPCSSLRDHHPKIKKHSLIVWVNTQSVFENHFRFCKVSASGVQLCIIIQNRGIARIKFNRTPEHISTLREPVTPRSDHSKAVEHRRFHIWQPVSLGKFQTFLVAEFGFNKIASSLGNGGSSKKPLGFLLPLLDILRMHRTCKDNPCCQHCQYYDSIGCPAIQTENRNYALFASHRSLCPVNLIPSSAGTSSLSAQHYWSVYSFYRLLRMCRI